MKLMSGRRSFKSSKQERKASTVIAVDRSFSSPAASRIRYCPSLSLRILTDMSSPQMLILAWNEFPFSVNSNVAVLMITFPRTKKGRVETIVTLAMEMLESPAAKCKCNIGTVMFWEMRLIASKDLIFINEESSGIRELNSTIALLSATMISIEPCRLSGKINSIGNPLFFNLDST